MFRMDYADRRSTAIVYAWMNIGISVIGGIIGGAVGYSTAVKMRGAVF